MGARAGAPWALPAIACSLLLATAPASAPAQTTSNPFPEPIEARQGVVEVRISDFASIPDIDGAAARMMLLVEEPGLEPGQGRLFVNDMRGPLYTVSPDGGTVRRYLDIDEARWGVGVEAGGRERGFQSFALHPDFRERGAPGFGKLYTWTDVRDTGSEADFLPGGGNATHHTVLLEWTARDPAADAYDGGPPREIFRFEQPFGNHNAGHLAFNPTAARGDAEWGLLYVGSADGGSGGDPLNLAQDPRSAFGKVLRIDPLGSNGANGGYGIPEDNPGLDPGSDFLPEIWASGVRNPQRFGWDPRTGAMYLADIGQNTVEELSPVTRGANLGWNVWEGSFRFVGREGVDARGPRSDPSMTYPVAEYDQTDPLIQQSAAATGVVVVRSDRIPALRDRVLFGDFPSGEVFHFDADDPPQGGQAFGRVLFVPIEGAAARTFLEIIQERNRAQDRQPATRADLRLAEGADGRIFLLNKHDGVVRVLGARARGAG